jgi:prolyl 4-hydroxylase
VSAEPEVPTKFDPNNDPAILAKVGAHVTRKLDNNPLVQRIEVPDLQIYVYQGFLGKRDCEMLIKKIDADAEPSTLYKGTEQAGFRTIYR